MEAFCVCESNGIGRENVFETWRADVLRVVCLKTISTGRQCR
jgi:hypothetical protein